MEPVLAYDDFVQQANTKFEIQLEEQKVIELELTEISEAKRNGSQEQFALIFRGPLDVFLEQSTRSVSHKHFGQFDLFLVPVSQDAQGFYYEAVFNRFIE